MLTRAQAFGEIATWGDGQQRMLAYVNAHTLNIASHDNQLHDPLAQSDLVLNDGLGLSLAARMRDDRFPENLNGSDVTMQLLRLAAERGWRVSPRKASRAWLKWPSYA